MPALRRQSAALAAFAAAGPGADLPRLATAHAAAGLAAPHARLLRHRPGAAPQVLATTGSPADAAWTTLGAPVVVDGAPWGTLEAASPAPFDPDDARFLSTLAAILGLALHARDATAPAPADALREQQHRARNELQLVMSLLMLHRRQQPDPAARRAVARLMDAVAAIGLAQDRPDGAPGLVELSDYLAALCAGLAHRNPAVAVATDLAPAAIPRERAIPLGLVVHELVADALSHAFPDGRAGTVTVSLHTTPDGQGTLLVRDDGLSPQPSPPGSTAAELVRRLVDQAGGHMHQEAANQGSHATLRFPLAT